MSEPTTLPLPENQYGVLVGRLYASDTVGQLFTQLASIDTRALGVHDSYWTVIDCAKLDMNERVLFPGRFDEVVKSVINASDTETNYSGSAIKVSKTQMTCDRDGLFDYTLKVASVMRAFLALHTIKLPSLSSTETIEVQMKSPTGVAGIKGVVDCLQKAGAVDVQMLEKTDIWSGRIKLTITQPFKNALEQVAARLAQQQQANR